jgi:anti-sigma factor (TIGR02949 family)
MTQPTTHGRGRPGPIDCDTAVRRLWDYLDGRLPEMARDEVEAHLATCAVCPPHFTFARTVQHALAASAPARILPEEEVRLRERVRGALGRLGGHDGHATGA